MKDILGALGFWTQPSCAMPGEAIEEQKLKDAKWDMPKAIRDEPLPESAQIYFSAVAMLEDSEIGEGIILPNPSKSVPLANGAVEEVTKKTGRRFMWRKAVLDGEEMNFWQRVR